MCSGPAICNTNSAIVYDQIGNRISKMAASKLQIHISQLVHLITTTFQRQYLCFLDQKTRLEYCAYCATQGCCKYFKFNGRHLGFLASVSSGRFG